MHSLVALQVIAAAAILLVLAEAKAAGDVAASTMMVSCRTHTSVVAFSVPRRRSAGARVQQGQEQQTPLDQQQHSAVGAQQKQSSTAGMTNLRFVASTNYATQPAPMPQNGRRLADFLFRDEHRDMLLAGGNDNRVQLVHAPDVSLYQQWAVEASKNDNVIAKPAVGDPVLRVTTTGIRFPGLLLRTIATVGCKQVESDGGDAPELQMTLVSDELQAEGPKPLVWVFQQLTGGGGNNNKKKDPLSLILDPQSNKQQEERRMMHSINQITATPNNDKNEVVFASSAQLIIDVNFPSVLLKILPVSKKMAEQQGSDSIMKVVERDIKPSLDKLRSLYMEWLVEGE